MPQQHRALAGERHRRTTQQVAADIIHRLLNDGTSQPISLDELSAAIREAIRRVPGASPTVG
jgi:hypothetical protein